MPTEQENNHIHKVARIFESERVTELSVLDLIWIGQESSNKLVATNLNTLLSFLALGGSPTTPDVADKGQYVFYVTQEQINAAGGPETKTVLLPQFAGKNFTLRAGFEDMADDEYQVLQAGGFKILKPDFEMVAGIKFALGFAEKIVDDGSGNSGGGSSRFKGKLLVETNLTMTAADVGKVVQFRAKALQVTLKIVNFSSIPLYEELLFESSISNEKINKIETQDGGKIYMNGKSYTEIYIAPGESCRMYRDDLGLYVYGGFEEIYKNVARTPYPVWVPAPNEIICNGQLKQRVDEPRIWQVIQEYGQAIVTDEKWNTPFLGPVERPYRGKWSHGDEAASFRVPDFNNVTIRGVIMNPDGTFANDDERVDKGTGIYQQDIFKEHNHAFKIPMDGVTGSGTNMQSMQDSDNDDESPKGPFVTDNVGGAETRGKNIGMVYVTRR